MKKNPKLPVEIHCGESGLSTRMFSPIAASLSDDVTVHGEGSILVRPMDMVVDALEKLGAKVHSDAGKLPLHILGGIRAGDLRIDASESSQLLTGLLIALAFQPAASTVHADNPKSIPYIRMTLDILRDLGIVIPHEDYRVYHIPPHEGTGEERTYKVEGDWSGASFHIVGAALAGSVVLQGLHPDSSQADRAVLDAVRLCGAHAEWTPDGLRVEHKELRAFSFDATHCPDLFPPLAALVANCSGTSEITGVSRLASKESNRALTIQSELGKLGIVVELDGDRMRIHGGNVRAGRIDSHNDHRIAMMGAILATRTEAAMEISNPSAVNKSYPDFFSDIFKRIKTETK